MRHIHIITFLIFLTNQLNAQSAEEYFKLAKEEYEKKHFAESLENINKAIKFDSLNVKFYYLKAESYLELDQYINEFTTYSDAIKLFPNQSYLYYKRGYCFVKARKLKFAIYDFTKAIELTENDTLKKNSYLNRGSAEYNLREFENAYLDYKKAYKIDSTDISVLINLGAVCDVVNKDDETLKYLLKAIEIDSLCSDAYVNIGFKYQELSQHEKAINFFNKAIEINHKDPYGYSNRSFNRLKIGDLEGAFIDIEKSLSIYPLNSYAYRTRALIFIEKGDIERACKDFDVAIKNGFTKMYGDEVIKLKQKYCKE